MQSYEAIFIHYILVGHFPVLGKCPTSLSPLPQP